MTNGLLMQMPRNRFRTFRKMPEAPPLGPIGTIKLSKYPQSGKRISRIKDFKRQGLLPGKRISKNRTIYYETRKNRSDSLGTRL